MPNSLGDLRSKAAESARRRVAGAANSVRRNSAPRIGVVELLVFDDVAAVLEQERR